MVGAPEIILKMTKFLDIDGREEVLGGDKRNELEFKIEQLASKGQRIIAVAYRKIDIISGYSSEQKKDSWKIFMKI